MATYVANLGGVREAPQELERGGVDESLRGAVGLERLRAQPAQQLHHAQQLEVAKYSDS